MRFKSDSQRMAVMANLAVSGNVRKSMMTNLPKNYNPKRNFRLGQHNIPFFANHKKDSVEDVAKEWWRVISEHGLAVDVMSESIGYPSKVEGYMEGDPITWDEFTKEEQRKLIHQAGGLEGMRDKLVDEGYEEYGEEDYNLANLPKDYNPHEIYTIPSTDTPFNIRAREVSEYYQKQRGWSKNTANFVGLRTAASINRKYVKRGRGF